MDGADEMSDTSLLQVEVRCCQTGDENGGKYDNPNFEFTISCGSYPLATGKYKFIILHK